RYSAGAFVRCACAGLEAVARAAAGPARGAACRFRLAACRVRVVLRPGCGARRQRPVRARARAAACAGHRLLRLDAGGHGHARDAWPFGAPAADGGGAVAVFRRAAGGSGGAHRGRGGAGHVSVAGGRRGRLVAGVPAVGAALGMDLPDATRGRAPRVSQWLAPWFVPILYTHITCVVLSGSLFFMRGCLVLGGVGVANHAAVKRLSYLIDTTLLLAAIALAVIIHQYPFVQAWLTVKVLLLVVY